MLFLNLYVMRLLRLLFCPFFVSLALADEPEGKLDFKVSKQMDDLLHFYCDDCHDSGTQKGDVRLDNLVVLGD